MTISKADIISRAKGCSAVSTLIYQCPEGGEAGYGDEANAIAAVKIKWKELKWIVKDTIALITAGFCWLYIP